MSRDHGGRYGTGRRGRGTGAQSGRGSSCRETLLAAVALQDHMARRMRMPGGPTAQPSTQPGAEMTLAQHLGLIPRPPPLLSEGEWNEVHLKARIRQHSTEECPICQEAFKQDAQVLLSCSHVFHKSCLASFERYARSKTCPLCRAVQYQKRVIQDGAEAFKQQCAIRIQAAVRGWLARRRVKELRRHHPPSDPRLKRTWAAERLEEAGSRLVEDMDAERGDVDALFAELDASLAHSRAVCQELEGPAARRLQERLQIEEAIAQSLQGNPGASTSARHPRSGRADEEEEAEEEGEEDELLSALRQRAQAASRTTATPPSGTSGSSVTARGAGASAGGAAAQGAQPAGAAGAPAVDWDAVVQRAKARGHQDCPICIGKLSRRGNAGIAWLSCTHTFHLECITAFEAYELSAGGAPTCPVCRASYQRRCFQ